MRVNDQNEMLTILKGWDMSLGYFVLTASQLKIKHSATFDRVEELLLRTNQFKINKNKVDFSDQNCIVFYLKDKFGDYGMISVAVLRQDEEKKIMHVKQWVISCRALGRRVEENILSVLSTYAKDNGNEYLEIMYVANDKNQPAGQFLSQYESFEQNIKIDLMIKKQNKLSPIMTITKLEKPVEKKELAKINEFSTVVFDERNYSYLDEIDLLSKWIHKNWSQELLSQTKALKCHVDPRILERNYGNKIASNTVQNMWQEALGKSNIDEDDDFFESGGDSFKAIFFISKIRQTLHVNMTLKHLYENPTLNLIVKSIDKLESIELDNKSQVI